MKVEAALRIISLVYILSCFFIDRKVNTDNAIVVIQQVRINRRADSSIIDTTMCPDINIILPTRIIGQSTLLK